MVITSDKLFVLELILLPGTRNHEIPKFIARTRSESLKSETREVLESLLTTNRKMQFSNRKFSVSVSDRISDYTVNVAIHDWICDRNWSSCLTWVSDWISDRNERSLKTSVAISVAKYVKKQNYFSHRSSDRRCFGRLMKIIETETNSIVMRISILRLATELATKISLFYISEVKKYCIYYKYIIYLNIFYTRKILKLVY